MAHSTLHLQRQRCEVHKKIFLEAPKCHFQHDLAKLERRLEVNGLCRHYEKHITGLHFTTSTQTSVCLPTDQMISFSNGPSSLILCTLQKHHWHLTKRQRRKWCPQTHFPGGSHFLPFLTVINIWPNISVLSLSNPLIKIFRYLEVLKGLYFGV